MRGNGWAEVPGPRGGPGHPRARCVSSTRSPTCASPSRLPVVRVAGRLRGGDRACSGRRATARASRRRPRTRRTNHRARIRGAWQATADHGDLNGRPHQKSVSSDSCGRPRSQAYDNMEDPGSTDGSGDDGAGERADGRQAGPGPDGRAASTPSGVHPYDEVTWERRDVVHDQLAGRVESTSSSAAWSSRTSGRSTPPTSSPPSTSAARSAPRARVESPAAHRPGGQDLPQGRARSTATSRRRRTPRSSSTS